MTADYQKLYAFLVGQIDDTLEMIGTSLVRGDCGYDELVVVAGKLKNALISAEEMYLDDTEENSSFAIRHHGG